MKYLKPSYTHAVEWIAFNDDWGSADAQDPRLVAQMITVIFVADIFHFPIEKVAADVVHVRAMYDQELAKAKKQPNAWEAT